LRARAAFRARAFAFRAPLAEAAFMRDRNQSERLYAQFVDLYTSDFTSDLPIYRELVAKFPGPVLEAGCATGRVIARLARDGHQVYGIETSRPMIELARERLRPWRERARVSYHDLRSAPPATGFSTVLVTLYGFNSLIDVEEQRRFLRHARQSLGSPGVIAIDCFCPLAHVRAETEGQWREIEREVAGHRLHVRDRRQMLTPLLERRTQVFRVDGGKPSEAVAHRRYCPPSNVAALLEEAGFDEVVWVRGYDFGSAGPVEADARPDGPFLLIAEC
jgi:SAM-dependent methyltransferase